MISQSIDNVLNSEEQAILNKHLSKCKSCQKTKRELSLTKNIFYHSKENVYKFDKRLIIKQKIKIFQTVGTFALSFLLLVAIGYGVIKFSNSSNSTKNLNHKYLPLGNIIYYQDGDFSDYYDYEVEYSKPMNAYLTSVNY